MPRQHYTFDLVIPDDDLINQAETKRRAIQQHEEEQLT